MILVIFIISALTSAFLMRVFFQHGYKKGYAKAEKIWRALNSQLAQSQADGMVQIAQVAAQYDKLIKDLQKNHKEALENQLDHIKFLSGLLSEKNKAIAVLHGASLKND